VTNNAQIAETVALLRNHGRREKYTHVIEGVGERLDALQAAILRVKLVHLGDWVEKRQQVSQSYTQLLAGLDHITLPYQAPDVKHAYHLYVIKATQRQELREWLISHRIAAGIHYPIPLHLQPAYEWLGYRKGDFPNSELAAREVLSLPLYPELGPEQVETIAQEIRAFFN